MTRDHTTVTDLMAVDTGTRQPTVEQRIERRVEVLREWLREGIPMGRSIPKNLIAVRVWEDADLGIHAIISPNEFTQTHEKFGARVRDIAGLLTSLGAKYGRPAAPIASKKRAGRADTFDRRDLDRQLSAAVSQWHDERDRRLTEMKRADAAEKRSLLLLEENAQKDLLISDLRRHLTSYRGLRVVE